MKFIITILIAFFCISYGYSQNCNVNIQSYNTTYDEPTDVVAVTVDFVGNNVKADSLILEVDSPIADTLNIRYKLEVGEGAVSEQTIPLAGQCGEFTARLIAIETGVCRDTQIYSFNTDIFRPCPN